VRARPRGLDREELEERVRQRRPTDPPFRRGVEAGSEGGYQPFEPEPEDALAIRDPDETGLEAPRVDNVPPEVDARPAQAPEPQPVFGGPPPIYAEPPFDGDDEPPYPYAHLPAGDDRGDGSALPLIGFAALAIMALAVGVILAGVIGGPSGIADASPTPTLEPTPSPTEALATPEPTTGTPAASATPEPTDGPVLFADGARLTIEPCGTYEYKTNLTGCLVDGSTRDAGTVWVLAVFDKASGTDTLTVLLRNGQQTIDRQDTVLGDIVDCAGTCKGLIWAAIYRDLDPGDYELVLRRNGDFADSATFVVE
jgi:hypothetical protein